MTSERKVLWAIVAGVFAFVVFLVLSEKVDEELAPRALRALVAIEPSGTGLATTGRVELESGTPFTLHAVLQAESWTGETIYFTDAQRLRVEAEEVSPRSLRGWTGSAQVRILWFTVEGFTPYFEVREPADLEGFHFQELFRPDWPRTWSIPGDISPSAQKYETESPAAEIPKFGTQRYHLRIEFFGPESEITPRERFRSLGADDLPQQHAAFPTVVVSLPGQLAPASRVFGLTQVEFLGSDLAPVASQLAAWSRELVAFSRLTVIKELLTQGRATYDSLAWKDVDLAGGPSWGPKGVSPGDLLRVGERIVVLVKDLGKPDQLDYSDLCFDYFRGARIQPLREVFAGEGLVEWAALGTYTKR